MDLKTTFENQRIHRRWITDYYQSNPLQDRYNDAIMDRLIRLLAPAPDSLFLDAGCGPADHTLRIAQRGHRCIGVDISEHVLHIAKERVAAHGLAERVTFACQKLGDLAFEDGTFDDIHCRGVLMHVPDWQQALRELGRVLKPGGRIAILEASHRALEPRLVCLLRRFKKRRQSRLEVKPDGLEFWSEVEGQPFVHRVANLKFLRATLEALGFRILNQFPTEFWDVSRFPQGMLRNAALRFNYGWYRLRLPGLPAVGHAIVAEKPRSGTGTI